MFRKRAVTAFLMALASVLAAACAGGPGSPSTPATTPAPTATYSQYQLEYRLLSSYPDFFWCDPDYYPIAREGQEQTNALEQFPAIQANTAEFPAIREHLSLAEKADYTDAEKLSIYREHKKLTRAVSMTPAGSSYTFSLKVGEGEGKLIEGTIRPSGQIEVTKEETSFNTCPICLIRGTLISTPDGPLPVEQIQPGDKVWTSDTAGEMMAAPVIKTSSTRVPPSFQAVRIRLSDGRSVTASPGHPTAERRALGDYQVGEILDGSVVTAVERVAYSRGATFDLLPAGASGLYRANGVWLGSTLDND
jgi:hypothetical protein